MRRILLYLLLGFLLAGPREGWAGESPALAVGSNSSATELALPPIGDVSVALDFEEVATTPGANVTLAVSTLVASTGQVAASETLEGVSDDPAILVSLTAKPTLRVLSFFPMAQMWLLREAYIESEQVFERMARAPDSPWSLWQMVDENLLAAPAPHPSEQSFLRSSEPTPSMPSPRGAVPQAVF
jgi:hypothetical protein